MGLSGGRQSGLEKAGADQAGIAAGPRGGYRPAMSITLTILGSKGGPAIRPGGPSPTSMLLAVDGRLYVVDCGLGVTRGFVETGHSLRELSTILITHHHSDHNLEFGNLIHTAWCAGLGTPVQAYGPKGLSGMWPAFCRLNGFDIAMRIEDEGRPELEPMVTVTEYAEGAVFDDGIVSVTALRNHHPPVTDSFALRFAIRQPGGGKVIVLSGDTAFLPAMIPFARDADLLVHEAMYLPGVDRLVAKTPHAHRLREHLMASHTLAEDVGRIARDAGVRRLVLNHLVPADDPETLPEHWEAEARRFYVGPLDVAYDGMRIGL
jgi:ribonuclease BN (tRNA processing enzyme)